MTSVRGPIEGNEAEFGDVARGLYRPREDGFLQHLERFTERLVR